MKYKLFRLFVLVALFGTASLFSCKKNTTVVFPVAGVYTGSYTVNDLPGQGALPYNFSILLDGSITTKGMGGYGSYAYAIGTWVLTGNTQFTANITSIGGSGQPIKQSITASFSNTGTLTNGTWVDTNNPYHAPYSGKFSTMQRVN